MIRLQRDGLTWWLEMPTEREQLCIGGEPPACYDTISVLFTHVGGNVMSGGSEDGPHGVH
jgi:hypothetical protein